MELLTLSLVVSFACTCLASKHTIPIEEYKTELYDLGQHVEYPETPVKIVKITKTIAVKVPVPYPVKVKEKVPYPIHVAKPYPVHVPHIVRVPQQEDGFGGFHHQPAHGYSDDDKDTHEHSY